MVTILLKKKKYKLPTNVWELSLEKGIQLLEALKMGGKDTVMFKISILAVLTESDVELWMDIPAYRVEILYENIPLLTQPQTYGFVNSFRIGCKKFGFIDLEKITVEEFHEIYALLDSETESMDKILSILYRPITQKNQKLKNILLNILRNFFFKGKLKPIEYVSYQTEEYKAQDNSDLFRKYMNFSLANGAIFQYAKWKEAFEKEFWQLFEQGKDPDEPEEFDPFEKLDAEEAKKKQVKSLGEMWGLFHLIFETCNGDKRLMDYWYKKSIREFYTHCTYVKQRIIYLEKINNG